MKRSVLFLLIFVFFTIQSYAQGGDDFLRSIGKIYAVVAVVLMLFIGMIIYLVRLDRKIKKLENHLNNE